MTERIDHAAKAREALAGSGDGRNFATDASVNAVAHALLALVEQQRIANLIALASTPGESDWGMDLLAAEAANALVGWVPHSPDDEHPEIRPEVAAALGINNDKETNE